ncbi:MAG: PLP-dependent aminotransferase family protein [Gemmatimonadetes bacterium]|nr:PLP-dependent aminotransferase family protein [Gemmatimonadota bacterium]MYC69653.1 PLP-dependent aminotransferase family protein [Gemmatimonadota bacterium]MYI63033.1 PLP-dependent aminotransferase family protein [Gemmatimonadota bacterium]
MSTYDFGSGRTDPGSFPTEALAEAASIAVRELGAELVRYPGDMGHQGLREVMAMRESKREGIDVSADHIALMNGSMQAVTLVAEALMEGPGDVIVTEELTYSGTIGAYKGLGAELVGVPLDEQGMRVDALADVLADLRRKGTPPRFIYTLATYQNPTGSVMPRQRRLELLEVARYYDTIVVEDNCYGDVHFEGPEEPALYALDDSPDVLYIGSLSKILGPGVRLGYLLARPPMLGRILDRRYDGGNSLLAAASCAALFRDRLWQHLAETNAILKEKRDAVFAGLEENAGDLCTWSRPVGGMFIWIEFPEDVDRDRLMALCAERGIVVARGQGFHIRREDVPAIRLAFGFASLEAVREGVPLLAECIHQARVPVMA